MFGDPFEFLINTNKHQLEPLNSYAKLSIFLVIQVGVTFIISIYIESVSAGDLLFAPFLDHEVRKAALDHPLMVLSILGVINFLAYYFLERKRSADFENAIFDNICNGVFTKVLIRKMHESGFDQSKIRVVFYRPLYLWQFCKKKVIKRELLLVPKGQFQNKHSKKVRLKYLPHEGCVGTSFTLRQFVQTKLKKCHHQSEYQDEAQKKLKLSPKKAKQICDMPIIFLSFPLTYFRSHDIFGIISIEVENNLPFEAEDARHIEEAVSNFSPFFQKITA